MTIFICALRRYAVRIAVLIPKCVHRAVIDFELHENHSVYCMIAKKSAITAMAKMYCAKNFFILVLIFLLVSDFYVHVFYLSNQDNIENLLYEKESFFSYINNK